MNKNNEYSEKMYNLDVKFENVFSLAGSVEFDDDLNTIVELFQKDLEKAMGFEYEDWNDFIEKIIMKKKCGLLAEVSQRELKAVGKSSFISSGVRTVKIIYAESYEDLLIQAVEFSENYRENLKKNKE